MNELFAWDVKSNLKNLLTKFIYRVNNRKINRVKLSYLKYEQLVLQLKKKLLQLFLLKK